MAAGSLPDFARLDAPTSWRSIDFISDLHLAAGTPLTFGAWAAYLRDTPADAVFMLGDLFEVWLGDDTCSLPFEQRCVELLRTASSARPVYFMHGNRDFLVGPEWVAATGVQPLADPTVLHAFGQGWLLTHGDALCLADTEYQAFRRMVRDAAWQERFLSLPLAERARQARGIRQESQARKNAGPPIESWADLDSPEAVAWLQTAGCMQMIHGHTHRPGRTELGGGFVRHVLSDWDLDDAAQDHTPARAEAMRLDASGLRRIKLLLPPA